MTNLIRSNFQDHPFHLGATRSVYIQYSVILLDLLIDLPLSTPARLAIIWLEAVGKRNENILNYHKIIFMLGE